MVAALREFAEWAAGLTDVSHPDHATVTLRVIAERAARALDDEVALAPSQEHAPAAPPPEAPPFIDPPTPEEALAVALANAEGGWEAHTGVPWVRERARRMVALLTDHGWQVVPSPEEHAPAAPPTLDVERHRIIALPAVLDDGTCSGCGARPSLRTGWCSCAANNQRVHRVRTGGSDVS